VEDQVVQIYAATNGYLDRINVDRVEEFLGSLTQRMHAEQRDLLQQIANNEWSDEIEAAVDKAAKDFADDFGQDLDEEGQPVDTGAEADRVVSRDGASANGAADAGTETEPEQEPAAV
jgi:F-type H+-transporting ATPase subunit alpha